MISIYDKKVVAAVVASAVIATALMAQGYRTIADKIEFTDDVIVRGNLVVGGRSNSVSTDGQTSLVSPGGWSGLNISTGYSNYMLKSIRVDTGCTSYDFGLYQSSKFEPGEEFLYVSGQVLSYYDGAPPILRDLEGTGMIHARFTNRGVAPCTFHVIAQGVGF